MTAPIRQTSFASGEVDVSTWKRTDLDEYLTAAQSLKNLEVGTTMLAKKCKGTLYQDTVTTYATSNSQIYEYIDQNGNYYAIMTADEEIHIFKTNPFAWYQTITSTPYTNADLSGIDTTLDNDNLIFGHVSYPLARVYISDYTDPVNPTFAWQSLNIYPYPAFDFNEVQYNTYTVAYTGTKPTSITFTAPAGTTGFTTAWIGGQIIGEGNDVSAPIGYAIITNVGNAGSVTTFTIDTQVEFIDGGSAPPKGTQYSVRQPAWSADFGYPSKVLYYQSRLWAARTKKQSNTIFGSVINQPVSYDVGVGNPTNAIIYSIAGNAGAIEWLNGGKQLEIYTEKYEYVCPQDENNALTPGTFAVRQQAAFGCSSTLKPISYGNDSYYLSRTGKAIINFKFNGVGLSYIATSVSPQSQHLVKTPVARALIQGDSTSQDNFIYFLNPDYTLTTFQFASETKLAALTPRDFNTHDENPVQIQDIETINNKLYILKYLTLTEKYIIEVMDENYRLDSSLNLTMDADGLVTGLTDFVGYNVSVIFENQDFGSYVVDSAGEIEVQNPLGEVGNVIVGMRYEVELKPMYIFGGKEETNYFKQITRIYVDYQDSTDFYIDGKQVPFFSFDDNENDELPVPPEGRTGTAVINPFMGWNPFQTFTITQDSPFDLKILGITYDVSATTV